MPALSNSTLNSLFASSACLLTLSAIFYPETLGFSAALIIASSTLVYSFANKRQTALNTCQLTNSTNPRQAK